MKILVIGLDVAPALHLFGDERLDNLRRLMDYGCFGRLKSPQPNDKTISWMSLLTGQQEDSKDLREMDSQSRFKLTDSVGELMVCRQVERHGGRVFVIDASPVEDQLLSYNDVLTRSEKRFEAIRRLLPTENWEYFQFVDDGLEQLYRLVGAGRLELDAVNEYYLFLDRQIGMVFELLNDETEVLVVSPVGIPAIEDGAGAFILASSNNPLSGEITDVELSELAPTLLELAGYDIPATMKRPSLVAGKAMDLLASGDLSADEEAILRERLSGLGYIS